MQSVQQSGAVTVTVTTTTTIYTVPAGQKLEIYYFALTMSAVLAAGALAQLEDSTTSTIFATLSPVLSGMNAALSVPIQLNAGDTLALKITTAASTTCNWSFIGRVG